MRSYHPLGIAGLGFITAAIGGWSGIVAFVGPEFGYPVTSSTRWEWTASNALLHLWPGVVALVAGLVYMSFADARSRLSRSAIRFSVLAALSAGVWLVIGPAVWPVFETTSPYVFQSSASKDFLMRLGSSLGPGLLLVAIGALVFEAIAGREPLTEPAPAAAPSDANPKDQGQDLKMGEATKPHPADPARQAAKSEAGTSPAAGSPASGGQLP